MNLILGVLRKSAVFGGRASRKEFWMFFLFLWIVFAIFGCVHAIIVLHFGLEKIDLKGPVANLYSLAIFILSLAVSVRRMHDVGRSGWWAIIPIGNLLFFCLDSQPGDNQYGPNPKGV